MGESCDSDDFMRRIDKVLPHTKLLASAPNGYPHFVNLKPSNRHSEYDDLDTVDIITTTLFSHCQADLDQLLDLGSVGTLYWSIVESSIEHYVYRIDDRIYAGCWLTSSKVRRRHADFVVQYRIKDSKWILVGGFEGEGKIEGEETSPKELATKLATLLLERQIWRGDVNNFLPRVRCNWSPNEGESKGRTTRSSASSKASASQETMMGRSHHKRVGVLCRPNFVEGRGRSPRKVKIEFPGLLRSEHNRKRSDDRSVDRSIIEKKLKICCPPALPPRKIKLEIIEAVPELDSSGELDGTPIYKKERSFSGDGKPIDVHTPSSHRRSVSEQSAFFKTVMCSDG